MTDDNKATVENSNSCNSITGKNRRTLILFEKHKWEKYKKQPQEEILKVSSEDESLWRTNEMNMKNSAGEKSGGVSRRTTVLFRKRKRQSTDGHMNKANKRS